MRRQTLGLSLALSAELVACGHGGKPLAVGFWRPAASYAVTLIPLEKARLLPELEAALGAPRDSVKGRMIVDSIARDSVFGRLDLPVGEIGLLEPMLGVGPAGFIAWVRGDSLWALLNSQQTDVAVWLDGRVGGNTAQGAWSAAQRGVSGRFRIVPESR